MDYFVRSDVKKESLKVLFCDKGVVDIRHHELGHGALGQVLRADSPRPERHRLSRVLGRLLRQGEGQGGGGVCKAAQGARQKVLAQRGAAGEKKTAHFLISFGIFFCQV